LIDDIRHEIYNSFIDAHMGGGVRDEGGEGGIKVYHPSKIFSKLVNKNAIIHQKGVPSPQNFHNLYIPSLPKFGKNLMDPPPGFSNRVRLLFHLEEEILYIKRDHNFLLLRINLSK
jgi:hypothetical protein